MKIKIKTTNQDMETRIESKASIKEVLINEDLFNPDHEIISICFRGKGSSGIIGISSKELEKLYKSTKKQLHLIKGTKIIRD